MPLRPPIVVDSPLRRQRRWTGGDCPGGTIRRVAKAQNRAGGTRVGREPTRRRRKSRECARIEGGIDARPCRTDGAPGSGKGPCGLYSRRGNRRTAARRTTLLLDSQQLLETPEKLGRDPRCYQLRREGRH